MANIYNASGATHVNISAMNNTYSYLNTYIGQAKFGVTTDLNKWVYSNTSGTMYKCLSDASTSSHTPQFRLFVADSDGSASSDAGLTYSGDNLKAGALSVTSGAIYMGCVSGSPSVNAFRLRQSAGSLYVEKCTSTSPETWVSCGNFS